MAEADDLLRDALEANRARELLFRREAAAISTAAGIITNALGGLQGVTDYGANYAERIRGYFTPPVTGNYYFWIAGSDSAELWISDDNDPVDVIKRAYVQPAPSLPTQASIRAQSAGGIESDRRREVLSSNCRQQIG